MKSPYGILWSVHVLYVTEYIERSILYVCAAAAARPDYWHVLGTCDTSMSMYITSRSSQTSTCYISAVAVVRSL